MSSDMSTPDNELGSKLEEEGNPNKLEGLTPQITPESNIINFPLKQRSRRWHEWKKTVAEAGLVLLMATGLFEGVNIMNGQNQAADDARFAAAKATAQTEAIQAAAIAPRAAEFTATPPAEPTATKTPTVVPTKAATATPEVPKVVVWETEQAAQKLQEAAKNNQLLLVDTWTQKGATIEEAKSRYGQPILVIKNLPSEDTFDSPIIGEVISVSVASGGYKTHEIDVQDGSRIIRISLNIDDEVLVQKGDKINPGTPVAKFKGNYYPTAAGLPPKTQLFIGSRLATTPNNSQDFSISTKNLLSDERGAAIVISPPTVK